MTKIKKYELKKNATEFARVKITNSKDAADFIRKFYLDDVGIFESFFILLLDQSNTTIGYAKISQVGVASTSVDSRIVAKYAIESLSTGVILAHNHPSGNLNASQADINLTTKIKAGLALFDIQVMDHVILTEDAYTSMADANLM